MTAEEAFGPEGMALIRQGVPVALEAYEDFETRMASESRGKEPGTPWPGQRLGGRARKVRPSIPFPVSTVPRLNPFC